MGPPLVAATIAAVIAFLTVKISKVPMVQDFGVLLSIGIVALLVAGVVLPTTIIGARERRSPTTKEPVESWVEKTVDRLGSLPRVAVLPLVIVAVGLPVLGLFLESGSKIESDPINWANQSSTSIKNARTLEKETGFATTLGVFVRDASAPETTDVFTDQMGAFVFDLVGRTMTENSRARRRFEPGDDGRLAGRGAGHDVVAARPVSTCCRRTTSPRRRCRSCWSPMTATPTQVLFQVGPSSLEDRAKVLDERASRTSPIRATGALLPGEVVGDHRRARRRRCRPAREHHRQPCPADDRRAAARRRLRGACDIATSLADC